MLRSQGCLQEDEDQMAAKGKIHLVPLRISWNAAMQFSVIICLLAAIQSPLVGLQGHLKRICWTELPLHPTRLLLLSILRLMDILRRIHIILFSIASGLRCSARAAGIPASLIQSAHEISGSSEYTVSEGYQEEIRHVSAQFHWHEDRRDCNRRQGQHWCVSG